MHSIYILSVPFLLLSLLFAPFTMADEIQSEGKALLAISPSIYHLGKVSDKRPSSFAYTITNNSNHAVKLDKITTSCGCTATKNKFETLLPGQEGKIEFSFDPTGRKGYARWEILIYTDLREAPIVMGAFDVTILQEGFLSPDFISFGEFQRGLSVDVQVWIAPEEYPDFKIQGVSAVLEDGKKDCFDFEYTPSVYEGFYPAPRRAYSLKVLPKKDIPYGRVQGKVEVLTDIPGKEKIEIPLLAKVIGDIGVRPDYLPMGPIRANDKNVRKISVYHRKGESFQIQEVKSNLSFLSLGYISVLEDQYYQLLVSIKKNASLPLGEFRGKIVVVTSHPEMKEVEIPVQGIVMAPQEEKKP